MKLFLDDVRQPNDAFKYHKDYVYLEDDWAVVKTYEEFVEYLSNNDIPEVISFDHDLCEEHYVYKSSDKIPYSEFKVETGYHCLLWLILYCETKELALPEIHIHTMNRAGYDNLSNLLIAYKFINQ